MICPQITQITQMISTASGHLKQAHYISTQRHKGIVPTSSPARSRPPGGRGPMLRTAAADARVKRGCPQHRPALSDSADLAFLQLKRLSTPSKTNRPKQNRRAAGASRLKRPTTASLVSSSCLCVFVVATMFGSVPLCLCGLPGAMDLRHLRDLRAKWVGPASPYRLRRDKSSI